MNVFNISPLGTFRSSIQAFVIVCGDIDATNSTASIRYSPVVTIIALVSESFR